MDNDKLHRALAYISTGAKKTAQAVQEAFTPRNDLPEPSRDMMAPRGAVWYLDGPIGDIRRTGENIVIFGHDYRHQSFRLILTEAESETIARTILAAANHQEEE